MMPQYPCCSMIRLIRCGTKSTHGRWVLQPGRVSKILPRVGFGHAALHRVLTSRLMIMQSLGRFIGQANHTRLRHPRRRRHRRHHQRLRSVALCKQTRDKRTMTLPLKEQLRMKIVAPFAKPRKGARSGHGTRKTLEATATPMTVGRSEGLVWMVVLAGTWFPATLPPLPS